MDSKNLLLSAAFLGLMAQAQTSKAEENKDTTMPEKKEASANVHCDGANSCKGKSACHSKANSCAGQNSCKAKGWIEVSEKECKKLKGKVGKTL